MTRWLVALGVALVVGYALGTCHYSAGQSEIEAASEATQLEIDELLRQVDSLSNLPPDTVLVNRVTRSRASRDTAAGLTDSAVAAIADSAVREAVQVAVARERSAFQEQMAATVALYQAQLAVRDTVIDKLSGALTLMTADRNRWQKAKRQDDFLGCAVGPTLLTGGGPIRAGFGFSCGIEVF